MIKHGFYLWERIGNQYLVTNDLGRFLFLSEEAFRKLSEDRLSEEDAQFQSLWDNGFLLGENITSYVDRWSEEMATMKRCLFTGTQLFILVLTTACNQKCIYCQAGESDHPIYMSKAVSRRAIDLASDSPADFVTIEFQGGEPTLNPDVLFDAVSYAKEVFKAKRKRVGFAVATNLTACNPQLIGNLVREGVNISTSLDGAETLHNRNRPLANERNCYAQLQKGMDAYKAACAQNRIRPCLGAIQTTSRDSLPYARQIVDAYVHHDLRQPYIRPLTPLGCAKASWEKIGYTPEEYLAFYKTALAYMMELCLSGNFVCETTATLYLRRILQHDSVSHTEFRSPCGGGVGQMAINCDGKVYTCDEARMLANMGDDSFLLGTVEDGYQKLIQSSVVHALCTSSCIEALPLCSDCAYSPFCAVCPVVSYGLEGDIISHSPQSYRCAISKGIIRILFEIIQRGITEELGVLYKWTEIS